MEGLAVIAIPVLLAEAMAAGRPVACSRVDGLTEVVEDGVTGCTVPVNDSGKMAEAIIRILKNTREAEAMGSRGHERVRNMFSLALR